jgi:hypothetical protein
VSGAIPPDKPTEAAAWAGPGDRVAALSDYFVAHTDRYTPDALRQAASEAGFGPDEIEEAFGRSAAVRRDLESLMPVRRRARWIVLAAYGLVYAVLGVALVTSPYSYGAGVIELVILSVVLGVALLISIVWIRRRRRASPRLEGALMTMLVLPIVLLVAVAGLCIATTQPFRVL